MSDSLQTDLETARSRPPVGIVTPYAPVLTETFIQRHIDRLPTRVLHIHGWRPTIGSRTILPFAERAYHKLVRLATGKGLEAETTAAYRRAIRDHGLKAVLAEYGEVGVSVAEACGLEGVPLIVHFHGYDASHKEVLANSRESYPRMFARAAAIVAVSRSMMAQLTALGAPPAKLRLNPYGADCEQFQGADPARSGALFLAVGRFTEKKAPALTLRSFAAMSRQFPTARLRMIGDGAQLEECGRLAGELGIAERVEFLGPRPHEEVSRAMRDARCFVQHSLVASTGDSEGLPVAIIEAQAAGLPVVATRHAGIPDIIVEGETGFLVPERDVEGMAAGMLRLARDPELAGRMGRAARARMLAHFNEGESMRGLWRIIEEAIRGQEAARVTPRPERTAAASPSLS